MSPELLTAIGIGTFLLSLFTSAFVFFQLGVKSPIKLPALTPVIFLFFVVVALACGIGINSQSQTSYIIAFGNGAAALIFYFIGTVIHNRS